MKILKQKIVDFLEKVTMNGLISEAKLNFAENGLKITAMDPSNVCMVSSELFKTAFINYNNVGEKAINSLDKFISVLKTFDKEVELEFTDSIVLIKENKKSAIVQLMDLALIETKNIPDLKFGDSFEIKFDIIKNLINNIASLNKNYGVIFETTEKTLKVFNNDSYKFSEEFVNEQIKGGVKVKMGEIFKTATEKLNGLCTLNLQSDYPLKIQNKNDDYNLVIIIAPRVDED